MSIRIAWRFYDPDTLEEYFLPVNPTEDAGSFDDTKNTRYEAMASTYVDTANELRVGAVVIQDAASTQPVFSYTGTVYTKAQYDAFEDWFNRDHPWQMRDDLGREVLVYVDKYSKDRSQSRKYKWKHTYSVSGFILEEL